METKEPTYVIAYARVSTQKQATEGEGLEVQEERLRHAATQSGWTLFPENRVFTEPFTGGTDDRPVYQAILTLLRRHRGKVRYFVVTYIDRFSREGVLPYQQMKVELATLGVELRDLSGVIQPSVNSLEHVGFDYPWSRNSPTAIGELVIAEMARYEKSLILTRMVGAQIKLTQDGYHLGRADDGYIARQVAIDGKKRFVLSPDHNRAPYFREMFDLRAAGTHSDEEIVRRVNALGYRSRVWRRWDATRTKVVGRRGGVALTVKQLQRIIQRPIYCGIVCEKWTHNRPILARGAEPLVSVDMFNRANRGKVFIDIRGDGNLSIIYDQYPERPLNKRHAFNEYFPFKNVVMCGCGKPLTASYSRGKSGQRYGAYHCTRRHRRYAVSQEVLEPAFVRLLASLELAGDAFDRFRTFVVQAFQEEQQIGERRYATARSQIEEMEGARGQLVEAFAQATSDVMRTDLEQRVVSMQMRIDKLRTVATRNGPSRGELECFLLYVKRLMEHPAQALGDARNLREQLALYDLVFAERPTAANIVNGTPSLRPSFAVSEEFKRGNSQLMNSQYQTWNTWQEEITRWEKAYWAIESVLARGKQQGNSDQKAA